MMYGLHNRGPLVYFRIGAKQVVCVCEGISWTHTQVFRQSQYCTLHFLVRSVRTYQSPVSWCECVCVRGQRARPPFHFISTELNSPAHLEILLQFQK